MNIKTTLLFAVLLTSLLCAKAQEQKQPLTWQELPQWTFMRIYESQISNNGKWYAYVSGPTQGDLTLTLQTIEDTLKYDYKIGGINTRIQFNNNSQFIAFLESPDYKEVKANEKNKKPTSRKLKLVSLKDTASVIFEKVQNFEFSNDDNKWLAIRFEQMPSQGPDAGKGTDLLLYNLTNKKSFNLGNVSEYRFNKSGQYLAYAIDAYGKNGNGVFLLNLNTGLTTSLSNDQATFSKITWNKEGTAFALLKSKKDKKYKAPVFSLIGVKNLHLASPDVFTYSGLDENQITSGFGISEHSTPFWSKDLSTVFFGISKYDKEEDKKEAEPKIEKAPKDTSNNKIAATKDTLTKDSTDQKIANSKDSIAKESPKPIAKAPAVNKKDLEKPDMIIWNWQDKRLQSAQRTQLNNDKNHNAMSAYIVGQNKFVSLADSAIKYISLSHNQKFGYGVDGTPYEYQANLDGQSYGDLYIVNIETGEKKLAIKNLYFNAGNRMSFSPNNDFLLYYEDGNYFVLNLSTLAKTNITEKIPTTFVNELNDSNTKKPATPSFGWTADGKHVLIRDNYDLWKISADGKTFSSLTKNWKASKLKLGAPNNLYPDDDFIDLKKDQYFNIIDIKNKQQGLARLAPNTQEIKTLILDDVAVNWVRKTKDADKYYFTKEQSNVAPDLYITADKNLQNVKKLTENPANKQNWAVSSGSRLISYVSAHGDTLQATILLPANYVEGQSYPTITYIYERLTDGKNYYTAPSFPGGGFNSFMYTSNGYAVLMPDIKYKLNDPGMSAVACVVPAVQAAIESGIVDGKNVAIHGHSWGGYQTSFLITQTNIFKAAVAGAPLTNMISMYSLIYWNTGSSNQSIFESSQGRLTTGYWDNWDAYVRNSPIYYVKNVNTPLIIMHNDKDGAVDYTQGIEYFNSLRRLNKPVVMLTYNGENHGLMKEVNRKDYAVRMMEYFDYYLKGKEAPEWWAKGVDYINLEKHLEDRAF